MSKILKIYWQEPIKHQRLHVGTLSFSDGVYKFKYVNNYKDLEQRGFKPIMPFLDFDTEYTSDKLFPAFSSRLPDPKRKDIESILKKYNLSEYNDFELLSRSEGRSPSDKLEFISKIDLSQPYTTKDFFVAGVSHGDICPQSEKCIPDIECLKGVISLVPEPDNKYDKYAVKILLNKEKLGYIPAYHSQSVYTAITQGMNVACKITEANFFKNDCKNCRDCIKMKITITH